MREQADLDRFLSKVMTEKLPNHRPCKFIFFYDKNIIYKKNNNMKCG